MIPMVKVVLLAGPALIASYTAHPTREPVTIGLSHHAGRHPMYKGGVAPISVRVVRC